MSMASAALITGIDAAYKFDEQDTTGTGTIYDATGAHDGTNAGADNSTGKINTGYQFIAANSDHVDTGFVPATGSQDRTSCAWIYPDTLTGEMIIVAYGDTGNYEKYAFRYSQPSGSLRIEIQGAGWNSNLKVSAGVWQLACAVFEGTTLADHTLYLGFSNGTLFSETATGTETLNTGSSYTAWIGESAMNAGQDFDGKIDEVYFWDTAKTSAEILELLNSGAGKQYPFVENNAPQVTLNSPAANLNTTSNSITFNVTVTDDIQVENVTFYINGAVNETNSSGYNGTYIFPRTLGDGSYNWSILAFDNESQSTPSATRYFIIDSTEPAINVYSPNGLLGYYRIGDQLQLNTTIIDDHLSTCWYDYNNVNTTFSCTSGVLASENFTTIDGVDSIRVWANDTFGNINSLSTSWDYVLVETSRIYDNTTTQTSTETFKIVLTKGADTTSVVGEFYYDGDKYTATRSTSPTQVNFTTSLEIPAGLSGPIPFYWALNYTNSTGTYPTLTSVSNQTVYNLSLYECNYPSIDGLTLNFTIYDSTNGTILNATMEATFEFYAVSGTGESVATYLFSNLNENRSNYMYCLESGGENVTVNAFLSYGATDYDSREYIISDGIIGNFTQNIPLYLTLTDLTDIVTITVQDQNYDPISGALVAIQRWNIGTNTYSTIGMFTTSSTGQGIMDLELYTTWYRAVVYIDGSIVKTTDVQKLSSTSWPIEVEVGVDNPYDLFGDISYGLTFDNVTNITTFTWIDDSGYTSQGCLVVQNYTSSGIVTIFNSCVTSVSGTVDYLITGTGTFTAYGIIYLQGYNQSQIVDVLTIQLGSREITDTVSPFGKVISFLGIGTAGLIGVAAGNAILGGALVIVVLIASLYFGFLNITWGFVWGIVSIMILVWITQRRKR